MSLESFKRIYYVEWAHRLLGRLIGVAFLVPLIYFALGRRIPRSLVPAFIGVFILGGLQGALGWFMVQSGLVDIPRVSPYRLTAHLGLAVAIYGCIVWIALDLLHARAGVARAKPLRRFGWIVTGLVYLMILAGGFVAGTKAGFVFNTFPLMLGRLVPPGLYAMEPWWINVFENVATVQFNHRVLAYVLLVVVLIYWWRVRASRPTAEARHIAHLLVGALIVQVGLGISTLLLVVPVWLGALHQAGALLVFTLALSLNHALARASRPVPARADTRNVASPA
jgi:heme a synthase